MHAIPLTRSQRDNAEWALAGVRDKADEDGRECRSFIHCDALILMDQEDTDDMLYRLEEHLQDLAYDARGFPDGAKMQGRARAGLNLAKTIRETTAA